MLPSLLITQEEMKLEQIRNRYKCYASHLWITKDTSGHTWPFLDCHTCNQMSKCRQLKVLDEKELNGY